VDPTPHLAGTGCRGGAPGKPRLTDDGNVEPIQVKSSVTSYWSPMGGKGKLFVYMLW